MTVERQNEECSNRTASLLSLLAGVSRFSPVCEKKAVFGLVQATRLNGIEIPQMQKVKFTQGGWGVSVSRFSPVL